MKTKILIVDDLRENILALSELIASESVEIFTANTADKALDLLLDHEFALALLDVMMPTTSGFELARLIRGVERSRHLPIIFVTAHSYEQSVIFEGYDSGAVDVLFKPLNAHIVRSKVNVFVRLDQQSRTLQSQVVAMARLKEEAEAANVAKSRFLANMSHEIRTPLSAVLGFADVLSQGEFSPVERQECLSSISRNGQLLLRIIDDILDLSRIEAQKIEIENIPYDLSELLGDLEATLLNKANDKGIQLKFDLGKGLSGPDVVPGAPVVVVSDPLRLKQILLNVIGNAIKFTHRGSVSLFAEIRPAAGPRATDLHHIDDLHFLIRDTGIGLTETEMRKIFEPFAQADGSTRRKYGGTGLGLAIARQMARVMGGDVAIIASEVGKGSVFEVTVNAKKPTTEQISNENAKRRKLSPRPALVTGIASTPLAQSRSGADGIAQGAQNAASLQESSGAPIAGASAKGASNTSSAKPQPLAGKKILVVDDVLDNRVLIERYLRASGASVGLATGGQEAIDKAASSEWDVILMDIQMPKMDGYEATAQLRKAGFVRPIIALTAHAMKEELMRCVSAGCDSTLTKPVSQEVLITKLHELFL